MLQSASLRLRDTASAWLTISFNIAIGGGALLGGALLDGLGIAVLPSPMVALLVVGLVFVLATDRARLARSRVDTRARSRPRLAADPGRRRAARALAPRCPDAADCAHAAVWTAPALIRCWCAAAPIR